MTAISLNIPNINTTLANRNFTTPSFPSNLSKNSNTSKLYLGPSSTNLPGVTDLFLAPYELVKSVKAMLIAEQINDQEGILVNGLRVTSTPFGFINSISQLSRHIINIGTHSKIIPGNFTYFLVPLSIFISILGFIICAIEVVLEMHELFKTKQFYSENYPSELELFRKALLGKRAPSNKESKDLFDQIEEHIFITKLKKLQRTYLEIPQKDVNEIEFYIKTKFHNLLPAKQQKIKEKIVNKNLERKKNALIRRVHPLLSDEIQKTVPEILQNLQSSDLLKNKDAKEKAIKLFESIKVQSMKKFLIHGIGLSAVVITVMGLVLSCATTSFILPLIILGIGLAFAIVRYCLDKGLMNSKGWEFKIKNNPPLFVKSKDRKMGKKTLQPPIPLLSDSHLNHKKNILFQRIRNTEPEFCELPL